MIKELIRSIVYGNKATSERYIHYLKSLGCMIGERCTIFSPTKTTIDITRPWLIEIGNDVQMNNPVPVSLLSGDRKPQIRFLGNHPSGSGNLYHKSFRM